MSTDNLTPDGRSESGRPAVSLGEQHHDPVGCHWAGAPHLGPCRDRSRESGRALTEIRTVLSRAETALRLFTDRNGSAAARFEALERPRLSKPASPAGVVDVGEPPIDPGGVPFDDPDLHIMAARLRQVIALLAPWRRGPGKTRSWVHPDGYARLVTSSVPELYEDEVGDEMFTGQQAVLGEVRRRLADRFGADADVQWAAVGVVDEYLREMVDELREEEGDDDA